jgi:hypothetical protein
VTEPFIAVPEPARFPATVRVFVAYERRHIPAHVVAGDWTGEATVPTLCGQRRTGGVVVSAGRAVELEAVHCSACARRVASTSDGVS